MKWRKAKAEPRIERAGEWLFEAHQKRERFAPLPGDLVPRDLGEAYAIQGQYVGRRAASLGPVTGYKIALTTPAIMCMRRSAEVLRAVPESLSVVTISLET